VSPVALWGKIVPGRWTKQVKVLTWEVSGEDKEQDTKDSQRLGRFV
jgi:hypothetical protein